MKSTAKAGGSAAKNSPAASALSWELAKKMSARTGKPVSQRRSELARIKKHGIDPDTGEPPAERAHEGKKGKKVKRKYTRKAPDDPSIALKAVAKAAPRAIGDDWTRREVQLLAAAKLRNILGQDRALELVEIMRQLGSPEEATQMLGTVNRLLAEKATAGSEDVAAGEA